MVPYSIKLNGKSFDDSDELSTIQRKFPLQNFIIIIVKWDFLLMQIFVKHYLCFRKNLLKGKITTYNSHLGTYGCIILLQDWKLLNVLMKLALHLMKISCFTAWIVVRISSKSAVNIFNLCTHKLNFYGIHNLKLVLQLLM